MLYLRYSGILTDLQAVETLYELTHAVTDVT